MRLWIDDLRTPPADDWTWVQTSAAALWYLDIWIRDGIGVDGLTISFDHDLGGDDTTRPVMLWLCDNDVGVWIDEVRIHTANPVGREWLQGMTERYLK